MNFASWPFLAGFLPLTFAAFHLVRGARAADGRQALLIAASLVFYAVSGLENLAVLLVSIAANYLFGVFLAGDHVASARRRKLVLAAAVGFNLVLLLCFKLSALTAVAGRGFIAAEDILIPLALSFLTFQQIGFVVACYKRSIQPRLFDYLFFVAFFPQLIMGPIVQYGSIAAQLRVGALTRGTRTDVAAGLAIFLFGLSKKVLLADPLGASVNRIFEAQATVGATTVEAWFAMVAFQLQLFLDFSAYSEMAIGLGRMFGINLPINFDRPLNAVDRFDLWRRWHITFVVFMRTHVFMPLVRHARMPIVVALAITGMLSGLWHGLGWTFVVWGLVQTAILLVVHARSRRTRAEEKRGLRLVWAIEMTFLTSCLVGVLFRAPTLDGAMTLYKALLPGLGSPRPSDLIFRNDWGWFALAAGFVWGFPDAQDFFRRVWTAIDPRPDAPRRRPAAWIQFDFTPIWGVAAGLALAAVALRVGEGSRFIYAQF